MAGHSEWSNIKHRKQKQDKKKAKKFGKLVKEITSEARQDPDPESNPTLASAIERAKEANMPKENIERAIKRATGELEDVSYESHIYEGYGPDGVAVIIQAETDNRNRTSTDLKNIFDDFGGELGEGGCVRWMFNRKGKVIINRGDINGLDPESLQLHAIEAGAEEIQNSEEKIEMYCQPNDLQQLTDHLTEMDIPLESTLTMIPQSFVPLEGRSTDQIKGLIQQLKSNDDVEAVYSNVEL